MGKRLNFWYGSIFGTYWMIYAVVGSFASVFMLAKGYSNSQIGITLAAANILAVVLQPAVAEAADRSKRLGVMGISNIMTIMMMVFILGMFVFGGGSIMLSVTFVLLIAWHTALQPLFNSLTFKLEESGLPISFGIARSAGSLAYSLLCMVLGTIVEHMGIITLPITAEITCAMLLISLLFTIRTFNQAMAQKREKQRQAGPASVSDVPGDGSVVQTEDQPLQETVPGNRPLAQEEPEDEAPITMGEFIRRNRLFFVLNLGVVGLYFSNSVLNNFMMQIVDNVGGTSEDMGRILGVMAFLEIPTMVLFDRIRRRFSVQTLMKAAAVGYVLKIGICWLANSVFMLFVGQLLQPVSFALFLPAMVYFTGENMSKQESVRGQALFTTMITVTTIFSSLVGGWILDISGAKALTFISTLATAAGAVIVFAVVGKITRSGPRDID